MFLGKVAHLGPFSNPRVAFWMIFSHLTPGYLWPDQQLSVGGKREIQVHITHFSCLLWGTPLGTEEKYSNTLALAIAQHGSSVLVLLLAFGNVTGQCGWQLEPLISSQLPAFLFCLQCWLSNPEPSN